MATKNIIRVFFSVCIPVSYPAGATEAQVRRIFQSACVSARRWRGPKRLFKAEEVFHRHRTTRGLVPGAKAHAFALACEWENGRE